MSARKSAAQHERDGTKFSEELAESHVRGALPKPPSFLSDDARKKFRSMCKQLAERRAITSGDADLLAVYCATDERWQRALANIAAQGEIVEYERTGADGFPHPVFKPNLNLKIAQDAERQKIAVLVRLGLTPDSRERVKPTSPIKPKKIPESENSLENLARECETLRAQFDEEQRAAAERVGEQHAAEKTEQEQATELEAAMKEL